jgi:hypothetical protein
MLSEGIRFFKDQFQGAHVTIRAPNKKVETLLNGMLRNNVSSMLEAVFASRNDFDIYTTLSRVDYDNAEEVLADRHHALGATQSDGAISFDVDHI